MAAPTARPIMRAQGFPEGWQTLCANCNLPDNYDSLLKREEEESIAALHLRLDGFAHSAASWHQEEDGREDDDQC